MKDKLKKVDKMKDTKKRLTVKNKRGVKATLVTGSSLFIECLTEAVMLNKGLALNLS